MIDPGEAGLLETSQIPVLAAAAFVFLVAALRTRQAGAPVFATFALVLGVVALREYSPDAAEGWRAYLSSHAARWRFLALSAPVVALVAFRDRRFDLRAHAQAARAVAPFILIGLLLVALGNVVENWGDTMSETEPRRVWLLLGEEALELLAYGLVLVGAVRTLARVRAQARSPRYRSIRAVEIRS